MNFVGRASLALASFAWIACGGGGGGGGPPDACPNLVPLTVAPFGIDDSGQQIMIDVQVMTITRAHLDGMVLNGLTFPNAASLVAGSPASLGGSNCGSSTGVDTSVVGGAVGEAVIVPEGQAGEQTLPLIRALPFGALFGAQAYTNYPGPGSSGVAPADRRGLGALNPVPGGQILAPQTGIPVSSIIYALTDDAGRAQFIGEALLSAATRSVTVPEVRLRADQTATAFVGTESVPLAEMDAAFATRLAGVDAGLLTAELGVVVRYTASIPAAGIVGLVFEPALQAAQARIPGSFVFDGTTPSAAQLLVTRSRQIRSTVLVPDGATVVLGGLRNNSTMVSTTGIPLFGDLPVLGSYLRSHSQLDLRNDLVVLITPKIIGPE